MAASTLPSELWAVAGMRCAKMCLICDVSMQQPQGGYSKSTHSEEVRQSRTQHIGIFLHYRGQQDSLRTRCSFELQNQLGRPRRHKRLPIIKVSFSRSNGLHSSNRHGSHYVNPLAQFGQQPSGRGSNQIRSSYGDPMYIRIAELMDERNGWKVDQALLVPHNVPSCSQTDYCICQVNDQVIIRVELTTFLSMQHSVKQGGQGQPSEEVGSGSG